MDEFRAEVAEAHTHSCQASAASRSRERCLAAFLGGGSAPPRPAVTARRPRLQSRAGPADRLLGEGHGLPRGLALLPLPVKPTALPLGHHFPKIRLFGFRKIGFVFFFNRKDSYPIHQKTRG